MEEIIELESTWGADLEAVNCGNCDWSFISPKGSLPERCPNCFQSALTPLGDQAAGLPYTRPAELVVPFKISSNQVAHSTLGFAKGIWFAPADLNPGSLQSRMQRIYIPMWLVDADLRATWRAEAGFDYEVVSHQDHFDEGRGGWDSRQVKERRIRWEPRLGRLARSYANILAPALEDHARLKREVGDFSLKDSEPFRPETVSDCLVRLPDRIPEDAWTEAAPAFRLAAAEECRLAAKADHIRQFEWQPEYLNQNWTLLLLPLYSTFYLDDEQKPQPVLVNAQTGRMHGSRRSSMKRAQKASLIILGAAVLLFLLGLLCLALGMLLPPLLVAGFVALILALLAGLGAVVPVAGAAWFNHQQRA